MYKKPFKSVSEAYTVNSPYSEFVGMGSAGCMRKLIETQYKVYVNSKQNKALVTIRPVDNVCLVR
jgi:hypothetical protein